MAAVQVRSVPEEVRETLVREARRRDQSLQTYLMEVLQREARSAKNLEWLRSWKPLGVLPGASSAELIRQGRREGDRTTAGPLGLVDPPDA